MQPTLVQVPPGAGPPLSFFHSSIQATLNAQLRCADGGDVATGAAADDDDVKLFAHGKISLNQLVPPKKNPPPGSSAGQATWVGRCFSAQRLDVEQQARRVFQRFLHGHQAQHGFAAVDDAVVVDIAR
jgi:hypothetical protein